MIQVDFKMNHAANVCLIANGQLGSYVVGDTESRRYLLPIHAYTRRKRRGEER